MWPLSESHRIHCQLLAWVFVENGSMWETSGSRHTSGQNAGVGEGAAAFAAISAGMKPYLGRPLLGDLTILASFLIGYLICRQQSFHVHATSKMHKALQLVLGLVREHQILLRVHSPDVWSMNPSPGQSPTPHLLQHH